MSDALILLYRVPPDLAVRAHHAALAPVDPWRGGGVVGWGLALGVLVLGGALALAPGGGAGRAALLGAAVGLALGIAGGYALYRRRRQALQRLAALRDAADGEVEAQFDLQGMTLRGETFALRLAWSALDQVIALPDATVLRHGLTLFPVPDAALPEDVAPADFRQWLDDLRETA